MEETVTERQAIALIGRCYAGLDASGLREEILRRLRRMLSADAAFFATVDPMTLLFTSATAEEPLGSAAPLFLENEFGRDDINKFATLAESADPVATLDRATRGRRHASARYREIMGPLRLGDELRAALVTKNGCWGVLCLHRHDASHGFDNNEIDLIRRISPHIAEGLRRAITIGPVPATAPDALGPGVIVLDANLAVVSMNREAERWLAEIGETGWLGAGELPIPVYSAAAGLLRLEGGPAAAQPPATVRLRSHAGVWLSLHASRLCGPPAPQIGVVIEPAAATQIGSLLLDAHGLTTAQSRVVALIVRGHSTGQIVRELHISANTVQEHLTAAFDKFGVRSRRELVAALLSGHH